MTIRQFVCNTTIYTMEERADLFASRDSRNAASHESDLDVGRPQATAEMSVKELENRRYVGLYLRLPA